MTNSKILEIYVALNKELNMDNSPLRMAIDTACQQNPWWNPAMIWQQIVAIKNEYLDPGKLQKFMEKYRVSITSKTIGIVAAGNIPLVCMHDVLCVLSSGHIAKVKLSHLDIALPTFIFERINMLAGSKIIEIVTILREYDAVIATGRNNSARYFKEYFNNYPHIIRQSRTSIAILNGYEHKEQLELLADDMLSYYSMGCRNVSYLFIPDKYDWSMLLQVTEERYKEYHQHTKWMNNYDYNRTLLLLNKEPHWSNDIIMLRESLQLFSPLSVFNFQHYKEDKQIDRYIENHKNDIQCVVNYKSKDTSKDFSYVGFGQTQSPGLFDYADGVDTMAFLSTIQ